MSEHLFPKSKSTMRSGTNTYIALLFQMNFTNTMLFTEQTTSEPASSKQPVFYITNEFFDKFSFIGSIILTPIICMSGLVGNTVGICVLGKYANNKRLTIYTYLLYLMSFDIIYLILGLLEAVTEGIVILDKYLGNMVLENFAFARSYLDSILNHMSSILIILMSMERFMALVSPFKVKHSYISRYPRTIIAVSFVLVSIYLLPFIISVHVVSFLNNDNLTEYDSVPKPSYFIPFDKFLIAEAVILNYLAPVTVLVLNVMIAVAYSYYLKQRSLHLQMNQADDRTKITVVVLCVATMYVLLSLPNLFIKTLLFIDDDYSFYGQFSLTFFFFINISDLMARLNAAIDFFIYILVSKRYRTVLVSMVCNGGCYKTTACRCCEKTSPPSAVQLGLPVELPSQSSSTRG